MELKIENGMIRVRGIGVKADAPLAEEEITRLYIARDDLDVLNGVDYPIRRLLKRLEELEAEEEDKNA